MDCFSWDEILLSVLKQQLLFAQNKKRFKLGDEKSVEFINLLATAPLERDKTQFLKKN